MDEKKYCCYITYAIPMDDIPQLPFPVKREQPEKAEYPEGFMPSWFRAGCFPEDEEN